MQPRDEERPVVVVIDDDTDVREAIQDLLQSVDLRAEAFPSVQKFLERAGALQPACLVLDVRMPGRSGMDFHRDMVKEGIHCPVIFISGHADVPMSVEAMKAGAIEFLTKPVRHQDLLDAIQLAMEKHRAQRDDLRLARELRTRFDTLTPRERAVMRLVALGHPNKRIAAEIGITEGTVKLHRGQVMRKMKVRSVAALVRIADKLSTDPSKPPPL